MPLTNSANPLPAQASGLQDLLRSLIHELTIYGISDSFARGLNVILVPLYARFLTTQALGQLDVLTATVLLGNYLTLLGFDSSEARYFYDTDDPEDQKCTLTTSLLSQLFWGVVLWLVLSLLRRRFAASFLGSETFGYLVAIAALTFPVFPLIRLARNHLRRLRLPKRYALLQTFFIVLTLTATIVLVVGFHLSVLGAIVGALAGVVVSSLVSVPLIRPWVGRSFSWIRLRQLLAYGLPLLPAGVALWTTMLISRYFIGYYRTLPELGLYSMAYMISNAATLLTSPIALGWLPFVQSIRRRPEANEVYRQALSASVVGFAGLWVMLSVFAPEILRIVTTPTYYGIASLIPLMTLSVILNAFFFLGGTGMAAAFKQEFIGLATVAGAVVNIGLNFILIPRFGIMGAAISTLISQIITTILIIFRSQKVYPIAYRWDHCALVVGLSAIAIVAGLRISFHAALWSVFTKVALVILLFSVFRILGIISLTEIGRTLKACLPRTPSKSGLAH